MYAGSGKVFKYLEYNNSVNYKRKILRKLVIVKHGMKIGCD